AWRAFYQERGWPLGRWLGYGIELDNAVIDAGRPATFGFHLCRGNQLSRWLVSGGYDAIAAPVFGRVHADRLLLEYDDERSGTFDPLRLVPGDKVVVLGLVTTKTSRVEAVDEIRAGIGQATACVGAGRLGARRPAAAGVRRRALGHLRPAAAGPRRQGRGAGPGHHQDITGRAAGPDPGPARPGTLRRRCGPARAEPSVRLCHLGRRQRH